MYAALTEYSKRTRRFGCTDEQLSAASAAALQAIAWTQQPAATLSPVAPPGDDELPPPSPAVSAITALSDSLRHRVAVQLDNALGWTSDAQSLYRHIMWPRVELPPPTHLPSLHSSAGSETTVHMFVPVIVAEHQRWYPLLGWSQRLLPIDPSAFTSHTLQPFICPRSSASPARTASCPVPSSAGSAPFEMAAPEGWRWQDQWHIVYDREAVTAPPDSSNSSCASAAADASEGWRYSTTFRLCGGVHRQRDKSPHLWQYVRRREWIRWLVSE